METGYDNYDEKYYVDKYLAFRGDQNKTYQSSLKLILKELRGLNIKVTYRSLYHINKERDEGHSTSALTKELMKIERITNNIDENKQPKSNLTNFIWIEAIMNAPKNEKGFLNLISELKRKIVDPFGG